MIDRNGQIVAEREGTGEARDASGGIGEKIRARRRVRGLSLQEVARRAEVSIGLLSQIERGLTSPSLRSLGAVCEALEMPMAWLFDAEGPAADDEKNVVVRRHQRRVLDLGARNMIKELMTPDACAGIQMMRIIIRPGGTTGETAYNHHEGSKCGTVVAGTLGLEIDGRAYRFETGDSFAFEATRMIRFWCIGEEETVLIWAVSPAVY